MKPGDLVHKADRNNYGLWKKKYNECNVAASDRIRDVTFGEVALVLYHGPVELMLVLVGPHVGWVDTKGWKRVTK